MIRIAITGPESSGKTTLTDLLGRELNATVFPEFAREYIGQLATPYSKQDLNHICEGHLDQFIDSTSSIQLIDTDFIVLKIWSQVKYKSVSNRIQQAVDFNYFDLHILCTPDIPWERDAQREHPNQRWELFELYKEALLASSKHFITVSGSAEERLKKSCDAITAIQS